MLWHLTKHFRCFSSSTPFNTPLSEQSRQSFRLIIQYMKPYSLNTLQISLSLIKKIKKKYSQTYSTVSLFCKAAAQEERKRKMELIPHNIFLSTLYYTSSRSTILVLAASQIQIHPFYIIPAAFMSFAFLKEAQRISPYFLNRAPGLQLENKMRRLWHFSMGSISLGIAFSIFSPFPFLLTSAVVWGVFGGASIISRVFPWNCGLKTAIFGGFLGCFGQTIVQWLLSLSLGFPILGYEILSFQRGIVLILSMWLLLFQTKQGIILKQQGSADHLLVLINTFLLPWKFLRKNYLRYKPEIYSAFTLKQLKKMIRKNI